MKKDAAVEAFSKTDIAARLAKQQVVYAGFIAQDVEKAAKELGYDFSGVDAAKTTMTSMVCDMMNLWCRW